MADVAVQSQCPRDDRSRPRSPCQAGASQSTEPRQQLESETGRVSHVPALGGYSDDNAAQPADTEYCCRPWRTLLQLSRPNQRRHHKIPTSRKRVHIERESENPLQARRWPRQRKQPLPPYLTLPGADPLLLQPARRSKDCATNESRFFVHGFDFGRRKNFRMADQERRDYCKPFLPVLHLPDAGRNPRTRGQPRKESRERRDDRGDQNRVHGRTLQPTAEPAQSTRRGGPASRWAARCTASPRACR